MPCSSSVALGSTGHIAAVTVAAIVGQDLLGSATLAGAPGATVVLGAAAARSCCRRSWPGAGGGSA